MPKGHHKRGDRMRDPESGLTLKQKAFGDYVLAGESHASAVRKAGYKPGSRRNCNVLAYDLASHPNIRQYILESLQAENVTPKAISVAIAKALHAVPGDDVEIHHVRLAAAKEANKMIGSYAPTKSSRLEVRATVEREPAAVLAFMVAHQRRPSQAERAALLGEPEPAPAAAACGEDGVDLDHKS